MVGKDARNAAVKRTKWSAIGSLILGTFVLVAIGLVIRQFWGPGDALAQDPALRSPAAAARSAGTARVADQPRDATAPNPAQVMAVVNNERITRRELAQACLRRHGEEVLETIVNRQLIAQECKRQGVVVSEQDIEAELKKLAQRFGLSADQWLSMLKKERDINPAQYRDEIIWPTLALRKLAARQTEVTPLELQQAVEAEFGERVQALAISVSEEEKAKQIHALALRPNADFSKLARKHSEDTSSASVGGVIPPIRRHVGRQEVEQVAFAMKVGDVSQPIKYGNQYLILKCERRIPATMLSERQKQAVQDRLAERIRDNKLRASASTLFAELQKRSRIVNVWNDENLRKQHPGVAALVNAQPYSLDALGEECIARHGREVLNGEINRRLLLQELRKRNQGVQREDIDAEVARAAVAYGFEKSKGVADVESWLKAVTEDEGVPVELYVEDTVWPTVALKKLVNHKITVTPTDIQKAFESNFGERVEVMAIVLGSQRLAQQVWDMARDNSTDQFFGDLANQYSIEPVSKSNFGKVPPIRRNGGQPLLEEHAFKLKPGELSDIIAVRDKYILLRCLGRTEPVVKQMDDAIREEVYKNVLEQKTRIAMSEEFDRIHDSARLQNFLSGESQAGKATAAKPLPGPAPARR